MLTWNLSVYFEIQPSKRSTGADQLLAGDCSRTSQRTGLYPVLMGEGRRPDGAGEKVQKAFSRKFPPDIILSSLCKMRGNDKRLRWEFYFDVTNHFVRVSEAMESCGISSHIHSRLKLMQQRLRLFEAENMTCVWGNTAAPLERKRKMNTKKGRLINLTARTDAPSSCNSLAVSYTHTCPDLTGLYIRSSDVLLCSCWCAFLLLHSKSNEWEASASL